MARIRTIKPEFYTSEDVIGLSPLARLLFIATWLEADREGRLRWKPATFKLRYFPADRCDIGKLSDELTTSGLVVLYGDGLAHIPGFTKHQVINNREPHSTLPQPPDGDQARGTAAQALDKTHATSTRESGVKAEGREGKEGNGREIHPPTPLAATKRQATSGGESIAPTGAGSGISPGEIAWRIEQTWRAHLGQWRGFVTEQNGVKPGVDPQLTGEIKQAIRDALLTYDRDLLGADQRAEWVAKSKPRAAGIGLYLDNWCTGRHKDNDFRNGGKQYLEHWRPWKQQKGKANPVERFADLFFRTMEVRSGAAS